MFIKLLNYYLACLFFTSVNFEVFSPFVPDLSIAKMAAILYIISMIPRIIGEKFLTGLAKYIIPLLILIIVAFISSSAHINYISSKRIDTSFVLNILMFIILFYHARFDERVFKDGFWCMALCAVIIAMLALLGIGVSVDPVGESDRMTVFGDNANSIAIKMAVSILIVLWRCLQHGKLETPFRLLLLVPLLLLLLMTGSRGGFLALVGGLLVLVVGFPAKNTIIKILFIIGSVLAFIGLFYVLQHFDVMRDRLVDSIETGNSSGRDVIWKYYLDVIKANPVLGVGYSGMEQASSQFFHIPNRSPHNVFIEIGLYAGVIGLLFYGLFLFRIIFNGIKLFRMGEVLPAMLLAPLLSDHMFGQSLTVKLSWIIMSYIAFMGFSYDSQKKKHRRTYSYE